MTAAVRPPTIERAHVATFMVIASLFLFWGVANGLNGVLIKTLRKAFTLTNFEAALVDTAFYLGYFMFALPAALFMQRFGYKAARVFGLVLYGAGALLFFPASELRIYAFFLGALFVTLLPELLSRFGDIHQVLFGLALVAVVVALPGGLTGAFAALWRRLAPAKPADA